MIPVIVTRIGLAILLALVHQQRHTDEKGEIENLINDIQGYLDGTNKLSFVREDELQMHGERWLTS